MSKILRCSGPPPHDWEHPGGRGRPPKYCPEHHPNNLGRLHETDQGAVAGDDLLSDPQVTAGGQEQPIAPSAPNPFIEKAKRQQRLANLEKAREVKAEKAGERTEEERQQMAEELAHIGSYIERAESKYLEAFKAANAVTELAKMDAAWDKADKEMNALLNTLNRRRFLIRVLDHESTRARVAA